MAIILGKKKPAPKASPAVEPEEDTTPAPAKKLSKPAIKPAAKKPLPAPPVVEDDEDEDETEAEETVDEAEEEEAPVAKKPLISGVKKAAPAAKPKVLHFLKRGEEAEKALAKEQVKIEQRQKQNKVRRFWMPKGSEGKITFLDGNLNKKGMLDIAYFAQHSVFMNNSYNNHFICTADDDPPCPICEGGDSATQVGVLTVINHDEYTAKNNKTYKDQLELFVAKRETIATLTKLAAKRGGLAGCTFDVSRSDDSKSAAVGTLFEFDQKNSLADLAKAFGSKEKVIAPFNYDELMSEMYLPSKELRRLGFGSTNGPIGSEPAPEEDYEKDL